jgi:steroid delta-isomerase-like uncharacterized protein
MKRPKEVLFEWAAAYNARDPHALAALYHDTAENHQVALGDPLVGKPALLESFITFFRAFPDNFTHAENIFEDGEWAIIEWFGGGTFTGPLGGIPPTGRAFTLRGCGFFRITEGKIAFQRGYFDRHTWFSQLGISMS